MGDHTEHGIRETAGECISLAAQTSAISFLLFRHLAVVGKKGHVATFDWQAGTLHTELQLQETCRDITLVTISLFAWDKP